MPNALELEAYMDAMQERYFAMFPEEKCSDRSTWSWHRGYIARVKEGMIANTTMETETSCASDYLIGLKRTLGEELHPRNAIRRRQLKLLADAGFDCTELLKRQDEMRAEQAAKQAEKKAATLTQEGACSAREAESVANNTAA